MLTFLKVKRGMIFMVYKLKKEFNICCSHRLYNEKLNEEEYKQVGIFPPNKEMKHNLKITEVADKFGLKPLRSKLRVCPFHKDKAPSLSLSDEKGVFNCFGCGVKGKTDKLYAMLKKLKNGNN